MPDSSAQHHIYILHGWAVSAENEQKWTAFRDELQRQGVQSTFVGLPGLTTPNDEVWTVDDYIEWLAQQLPNKKVTLLGHSFGGQLSTVFAARFPNRVAQLILVDSAGLRVHTWQKDLKRSIFKVLATVGRMFAWIPGARWLLYKVAREQDYYQASSTLRKTMANVLAYETQSELASIQCQTLLIWGRNDTATPLSLGTQFALLIPQAELEVIDEARHSPQFTHHTQVAQVVSDWMQRL